MFYLETEKKAVPALESFPGREVMVVGKLVPIAVQRGRVTLNSQPDIVLFQRPLRSVAAPHERSRNNL